MASPTQWTWVWVNSRSWWWRGRPGVLQSMGSQRVGHDWATELNWTSLSCNMQVSGSPLAQMVKNSPAMQAIWLWSPGWEDTLEKGMATNSTILAWKIPWTELVVYSPWCCSQIWLSNNTFPFHFSSLRHSLKVVPHPLPSCFSRVIGQGGHRLPPFPSHILPLPPTLHILSLPSQLLKSTLRF